MRPYAENDGRGHLVERERPSRAIVLVTFLLAEQYLLIWHLLAPLWLPPLEPETPKTLGQTFGVSVLLALGKVCADLEEVLPKAGKVCIRTE